MIYYRQAGSKWAGYLKGNKLYAIRTGDGHRSYHTWIGLKEDVHRFKLIRMTDKEVRTLKLELL